MTEWVPRVGVAADAHALSGDRELFLAGLHWPGEHGLVGHSDGDVAAHACCDALFSAAGLGDLGKHFGTDREEWRDASGVKLLNATAEIVRKAGFRIGNVAVQVIGERPRVGARADEASRVLSESCGASVLVTATSTDRLGFTGRSEGIAAIATALVFAPVTGP
jgi:2-C-methyl-D-erythritol 2,4-cyclodiphosphate synthase